MADSTLTELTALVRRLVAFPAPPTGGADKLSDTDILRWLNDWFKKMSDLVYGIPVYLEITVTAAGVIAVTTGGSNSTPAVVTAGIVKSVEDFTFVSWPNLRSVGRPINRTTGIATNDRAPMTRANRNEPTLQYRFRESSDYYEWYDYVPGKGLVFLPITINETNTIRIPYKQDYVRLATGDKPAAFFAEDDVMAPVNHAAYYCAVILGLDEPDRFIRDRDSVTGSFIAKKYTKDTGSALGFDDVTGAQLAR